MYKMRMQAIRTAIISKYWSRRFTAAFTVIFVCNLQQSKIDLSVIPFSYKAILFSNLLFLAFTSSSWLEQDCPIVIEGLIEAMLTLETFNLLIPFSDFLAFIRPDLLFTTSSLLSWPESALSVAFGSVATFSSMSRSAAGLSRLVILFLIFGHSLLLIAS